MALNTPFRSPSYSPLTPNHSRLKKMRSVSHSLSFGNDPDGFRVDESNMDWDYPGCYGHPLPNATFCKTIDLQLGKELSKGFQISGIVYILGWKLCEDHQARLGRMLQLSICSKNRQPSYGKNHAKEVGGLLKTHVRFPLGKIIVAEIFSAVQLFPSGPATYCDGFTLQKQMACCFCSRSVDIYL